jgi:N-formylglutamate amidohydrolase
VHVNRPYAGGFITEHYGRPARGIHALQLEINRALYLNEATFERSGGFEVLKATLTRVLGQVMSEIRGMHGGRAAAE